MRFIQMIQELGQGPETLNPMPFQSYGGKWGRRRLGKYARRLGMTPEDYRQIYSWWAWDNAQAIMEKVMGFAVDHLMQPNPILEDIKWVKP